VAFHPGEVLREEFLKPRSISPYRVAKAIGVSAPTVNDIVLERRAMTAEMATRLALTNRSFPHLNAPDARDLASACAASVDASGAPSLPSAQ